jgi:hypothetical protein
MRRKGRQRLKRCLARREAEDAEENQYCISAYSLAQRAKSPKGALRQEFDG